MWARLGLDNSKLIKPVPPPDTEVINAVRPGMASIPDAVLLCASGPYARRGALWNAHHRHYGREATKVLAGQAATRDMNPSVSQSYNDRHVAEDAARAAAEYGAQFRSDIEGFVAPGHRGHQCGSAGHGIHPGRRAAVCFSPYARRGALWNAHHRHYGREGDEVLVWQAATRDMNPSVPQSYIDRHVAEDAARAAAEYGAQFRSDIEGFVAREVIDAATVPGRYELPPMQRR